MNQAIDLLQSPDTAAADCLESVLRSAHSYDRDLVLIAAAIYARPDFLSSDIVSRIVALMAEPGLPPRTCGLAREVLEFLLATALASSVLKQVTALASQPGLYPEVYAELCHVLEYAGFWAGPRIEVGAVVSVAEAEHFGPYRERLCKGVIEPALHASGESADIALLERTRHLYGENPGHPHLLYTIQHWRQFPAAVREWAAEAVRDRFPWHDAVARRLGGESRRLLVMHNINDGQGDEILRWVPLVQAFLDFNPKLEAVVVSRRVYLAAHPRVTMVSIANRPAVDEVLEQPFDAVIDFFESKITELNYDVGLESRIQEYARARKPFLFASSTKGFDPLVFERVEIDGRAIAQTAGLNVQRVENIYETTSRLIAELGLPLRCGEDSPVSEFVLAGRDWPEARMAWHMLAEGNTTGRPVAMMNAFGGVDKLKGFVEQTFDAAAAEIERLTGEGYFVVLIPNGAAWGTVATARQLADRVPSESRQHVAIAPAPTGSGEVHESIPGAPPLPHQDYVMRQFLYFTRYADLVVTVEGWLMHVAWCLGKPYRVLTAPYSQGQKWHPYVRTRRQGVASLAAERSGRLDPSAPSLPVEPPRKFILLFLLRELGGAAGPAAIPLLRQALSSPDRFLRRAAAEALGKFPGPEAAKDLVPLLEDSWCGVRGAAAQGLLKRPGVSLPQETILGHLYIGQARRDWTSFVGLGEGALPALEVALRDDDPVVRREALEAQRRVEIHINLRRRQRDRRPPRARIADVIRLLLTPRRWAAPETALRPGTVLILTPVKDAVAHLERYCQRLLRLTYPHGAISLGFLESDSSDETLLALPRHLRRLRKEFRRAGHWKKDFGYQVPEGIHRGAELVQAERRAVLAKSRNHLLSHALDDEEWVLWLDVDVIEYPPDIIERLLATGKDIVHPHCVLDYGGQTFDKNAWRDHGRLHLEDLRSEGDLVELDAVGGTMLLVCADLHRDGLVFPSFPYGLPNPRIRGDRGELETEGLGMMAHDMGHRCWGMPNLEIRHGRW
jgi:HEAT repeat protein